MHEDNVREQVTNLLAETDAWSGIEREEDERVRNEVLSDALVEEPVGVELLR